METGALGPPASHGLDLLPVVPARGSSHLSLSSAVGSSRPPGGPCPCPCPCPCLRARLEMTRARGRACQCQAADAAVQGLPDDQRQAEQRPAARARTCVAVGTRRDATRHPPCAGRRDRARRGGAFDHPRWPPVRAHPHEGRIHFVSSRRSAQRQFKSATVLGAARHACTTILRWTADRSSKIFKIHHHIESYFTHTKY